MKSRSIAGVAADGVAGVGAAGVGVGASAGAIADADAAIDIGAVAAGFAGPAAAPPEAAAAGAGVAAAGWAAFTEGAGVGETLGETPGTDSLARATGAALELVVAAGDALGALGERVAGPIAVTEAGFAGLVGDAIFNAGFAVGTRC